MGPIPQPDLRTACAQLAVTLFLVTGCAESHGGNPPDCPAPASETAPAGAPESCEDEPGGVGY